MLLYSKVLNRNNIIKGFEKTFKVFLLKENVPADTYKFFVEKLLLTLREEIAGPCRDVTLCLASRASLFFRWAAYSTPIYLAGDDFKHGSIS